MTHGRRNDLLPGLLKRDFTIYGECGECEIVGAYLKCAVIVIVRGIAACVQVCIEAECCVVMSLRSACAVLGAVLTTRM